jgi:EAL domain-containing protein (putative c-di-GMP-specific phosphodiesterase class I)/AmiR/NasT family two-component response regulator
MTSTNPAGAVPALVGGVIAQASIVVIDDTPDNVALLERILLAAGASEVRGFTDPRVALEACVRTRPDLVLLDLHMPHLDALAVMGHLQESLAEDDFLPVIVLTADITPEARAQVLAAGAKDFLTKPFDITEVLLRVQNLLETGHLYRRLQSQNSALLAELERKATAEREATARRAELEARITKVLADDTMCIHFQPIVDLTNGSTVGNEALTRFTTEPVRPPNEWFAEAASIGRGIDLEAAAIEAAIAQLGDLPPAAFLSINASPATVCSRRLTDLLGPAISDRIVIELTEHDRVDDYDQLLAALEPLRALGIRLAVDDTGAGYASLNHILRLGADILKLDIGLTRTIDHDPVRRSLASALVAFAHDIGAAIIAEGVETQGELDTLRGLGVPWAQGYHLGKPAPIEPRSAGDDR